MTYISDILYWISTGLLVPVVLLLILLFGRSLLLIGSFFGQYAALHKSGRALRDALEALTPDHLDGLAAALPARSSSPAVACMRRMLDCGGSAPQIRRLLADFEIAADKELAVSKTLAKMGPMLGLMGTLIPMGPALVGLASGDIASMAYNMQVAFATTVVGLFSSAVGFITQQVKRRWYLQQMTDLEFLADLLDEKRAGR